MLSQDNISPNMTFVWSFGSLKIRDCFLRVKSIQALPNSSGHSGSPSGQSPTLAQDDSVVYFVWWARASTVCSFAERFVCRHLIAAVLQSRGLKGFGPKVLETTVLEACDSKRAHADWSFGKTPGCRTSRWRPADRRCPTAKNGGN